MFTHFLFKSIINRIELVAGKMTRYNLEQNNKKPVMFLIVRHPFDRLISYFREKIQSRRTKLSDLIIEEFRSEGIQRLGPKYFEATTGSQNSETATFWEFVTAILRRGKFL